MFQLWLFHYGQCPVPSCLYGEFWCTYMSGSVLVISNWIDPLFKKKCDGGGRGEGGEAYISAKTHIGSFLAA